MADARPRTTPAHPAPRGFADLGVPAPLVTALAGLGVLTPFPIQADTLPDSLSGRDVLGRGRTGSGKTFAFLLPLVARLSASRTKRRPGRPRALVLAPTRELARQIDAALAPLAATSGLRSMTVFGGVAAGPQVQRLRQGVDVVVACPGRLEDLLRGGHADLGGVEITVLDEADHMADLGFLPVVRRLLERTPADGQRLLFSATLDGGVDVLVKRFLHQPAVHSVDSAQSPVQDMEHHVLQVSAESRVPVIADLAAAPGRTVVFTRTKFGAKALARKLNAAGVASVELHGNLSQNARSRNLTQFSDGTASTLVATDIAARGIHVDDVTLVIHADPPIEHKAYLHRSGRTARAGASGTVVTMVTDPQLREVRDMTRKAGIKPVVTRTRPGDPLLATIAPGERTYTAPQKTTVVEPSAASGRGTSAGRRRRRGGAAQTSQRQGERKQPGAAPRRGPRAGAATTSGRAHSAASFSSSARGR